MTKVINELIRLAMFYKLFSTYINMILFNSKFYESLFCILKQHLSTMLFTM